MRSKIFLLGILVVFPLISGCESPQGVVRKAYKALVRHDFGTFHECLSDNAAIAYADDSQVEVIARDIQGRSFELADPNLIGDECQHWDENGVHNEDCTKIKRTYLVNVVEKHPREYPNVQTRLYASATVICAYVYNNEYSDSQPPEWCYISDLKKL